ncbi:TonB-dependent receptor domain-containing protein [Chitinibacter tainanensis]|uniref:TonB-dependent receptor domain-containing protein n=1 Tax=Chitinibacter tainanensis TaxID=230667 RepID=UPI00041955DA|nr:TonB-dependent receptor [Chitinibacter tainanensis]
MNTRLSQLYLVVLSTFPLLAQAANTAEPLEEIVVTASRIAQPEREVIGDVTILTAAELAREGQSSLPEVLARQPGIQTASNGGPGKAMNLFIRGANTNQSIVLIDGVRVGSATTGTAALQNLPLAQIERIEILRGPAASLYGADAIGGVIQIFTKRGQAGMQPAISLGMGTQDSLQASASLSGGTATTRYAASVSHYKTDGISALVLPKYAKYNSDADGYENTSGSLSLSHQLATGHELGASLLVADSESHYDNAYAPKVYDYRDQSTSGALQVYSSNQFTERWHSRLQVGQSLDNSYTYAPAATAAKERSQFKTQQTQISWLNDIQVGPGTATLGAETLNQEVSGTTKYDVDQRRINSFLGGYLAKLGALSLQGNLRSDDNSQFGRQTTGSAGASYQLNEQWQLGGSYGTAYKAPTFNDLYFPNYGNPHLKPQESAGGELFTRYRGDALQLSLTGYRNTVKNFILTRTNTVSNVERVRLQGITFTSDWQSGNWLAGVSYDYLDAKDLQKDQQLARRAKHSALAYAGYAADGWQLRAEVQGQSKRYDDIYGVGRVTLAGYGVVNLSADYQLSKDWSVNARVNNLFDRDYTQVYDYGTLGLNGMLTLRWAPQK